jgi:hypothetical protein
MPHDNADLQKQVDELKAENERLRKQLADTRAQRAEYMKYITELAPAADGAAVRGRDGRADEASGPG